MVYIKGKYIVNEVIRVFEFYVGLLFFFLYVDIRLVVL